MNKAYQMKKKSKMFNNLKKIKQEFVKILDQEFEELCASKAQLEFKFVEAMNMFPENKLLNEWKESYQKCFQMYEVTMASMNKRRERD